MIEIKSKGDFKKTQDYLNKMAKQEYTALLKHYGEVGVRALSSSTPKDSGITANSWYYDLEKRKGKYYLVWRNSNIKDNTSIAILLQYGHSTGTGGWVEGRDYINPAIAPIFDQISSEIWRTATNG